MHDVSRDLRTLFGAGMVGGLSDGQLLDRFVAGRDEAAFEALVVRHGPMVWGVCRRVLGDHHEAEDAFQATFLVLASRASSVSARELVANWLYGVAFRKAIKARAIASRRRARERPVFDMPDRASDSRDRREDLQPLLDEEIRRLPEKYRVPIILCELEGKTHKEAARQLGWPIGTLSGRLSRARTMLARRVARRDLSLGAGSLAVLRSRSSGSASMPSSLVVATVEATIGFGASRVAARGHVSAKLASLAGRVVDAVCLGTGRE